MVRVVGWICFILGILTLVITVTVYCALVMRAFAQRGTYLARGLLVSLGFLLVWAALVHGGGPRIAAFGLGLEIAAALMTRHELHKRM